MVIKKSVERAVTSRTLELPQETEADLVEHQRAAVSPEWHLGAIL